MEKMERMEVMEDQTRSPVCFGNLVCLPTPWRLRAVCGLVQLAVE